MERGVTSAMPLEQLFPRITAADAARMRTAMAALDAARPAEDAPTWHWMPGHATFPGTAQPGTPVIICTAVTMNNRLSDWTEFELDICWTPDGRLEVTAQVGVGCWCPTDHNTHYVEQINLSIDDTHCLAEAFEKATEQIITWAAGPSDPSIWRQAAGLPSPTT